MTRIVIEAFGTRGDVAPLTGLGARLRDDLGVDVAIAAQRPYGDMIAAAGLEFRLLPRDTEEATRTSGYGQALVDGARMRPSKAVLAAMRDDLAGVGEAMAHAGRDADLLLLEGPVGSLLGYHVAEALGVPSMGVALQPASATAEFAPPPLTARSFGRMGNRMAWHMAGGIGEKVYTPLIDDLRRSLGVPPRSRRAYQAQRAARWPILYGFSPHVVPRPRDWRPGLDVTGYWWPAEARGWRPPAELVEFLEAGPPPVYVGFGSTATAHGEKLSETISRALHGAGVRGVVQSGWARLQCAGDDVLTVDDIPHAWLFPRMAAIVHHGGAGTAAAALRAGVPSVPVAGIVDQPFWSHRLHRLGAATRPLHRHTLTADDLATAITAATTTVAYRERAEQLSHLLADEDGAADAAGLIAAQLNTHPTQETRNGR
ncbi:glycosyltransferase [Mycobacterium sp. NPDC050041]|uniref:glycosyltransferase n=1 Tax=Mycobacterium sp. NPDC050041 TaxID=3364293 RepID=UPI003C2E596D